MSRPTTDPDDPTPPTGPAAAPVPEADSPDVGDAASAPPASAGTPAAEAAESAEFRYRSPIQVPPALWVLLLSLSAALASLLQVALKRPEQGLFVLTLTFAVCAVALVMDISTRSIPNGLTYPALLLGVALNGLLAPALRQLDASSALAWLGAPDFVETATGFAICAAFALVSFAVRGLGGGDAKLVIALGALLGRSMAIAVLFHALLIAAVIGLVNWIARGSLIPRLQVLTQNLVAAMFSNAKVRDAYPFSPTEAPFALSIFLGLVLAQFVQLHALLMGRLVPVSG